MYAGTGLTFHYRRSPEELCAPAPDDIIDVNLTELGMASGLPEPCGLKEPAISRFSPTGCWMDIFGISSIMELNPARDG